MNPKPLGRLEQVDLRTYWEREDTHFTPWMAEEENIMGATFTIAPLLRCHERWSPYSDVRETHPNRARSWLRYQKITRCRRR